LSLSGTSTNLEEVVPDVVSTFLGKRDLYADYYSFNVLRSKEARQLWIQPDLKQMPGPKPHNKGNF
jgi:hypothetical protein